MKRAALAVGLAALSALPIAAQLPGTDDSRPAAAPLVSGRVLDEGTGQPIAYARLRVSTANLPAFVVRTGIDGTFEAPIPAGARVAASKPGYATAERARSGREASLDISLQRSVSVSGRVIDTRGEPLVDTRVMLDAPPDRSGRSRTVAVGFTDDRGDYRIGGLAAGRFVVRLLGVSGGNMSTPAGTFRSGRRAAVYYPGVNSVADAIVLSLDPGADHTGIDFVTPPVNLRIFDGEAATGRPGTGDAAVPGSAIVRGVVRAGDRPVPHANVSLSAPDRLIDPRTVTSDIGGEFLFTDLPAGRFRLRAAKTGYSQIVPTARRDIASPGDSPSYSLRSIEVRGGETRVDLGLARQGSMSGSVRDEYGEPMAGASVQLLAIRYEAGRRRLVPAGPRSRLTNDRGEYRLFGLPAGQYIVSAAIGDVMSADVPGYARSYFPGTASAAEARFVPLGQSQELDGIDVVMSRGQTARVAGRLVDATGQPTRGGSLVLMPSQQSTSATNVQVGAKINADGAFEFPNVAPGQYVIQANRGRRNSWTEGEFGALPVAVGDADVTGLLLEMSAGSTLTGRVVFEGDASSTRPATYGVALSTVPVDFDLAPSANLASANIRSDWSFEMRGLSGPRRLHLARTPPGWMLKAIMIGGEEVTDQPLALGRGVPSVTDIDVILTDRVSQLRGTVTNDRGQPIAAAQLIALSYDQERWFYGSRFIAKALSGEDGTFAISGLPSGVYYVAAVAESPAEGPDAWRDPSFLESLVPRASTVTLGDGETVSVTPKLQSR